MTSASFQSFGKWDSRRQWLNKCVRCTSGLLGIFLEDYWGIGSEYHQVHKRFSISINLIIYVCHKVLLFPTGCRLQMRAELGLHSPPVVHGFRHTDHEMWTGFLNNLKLLWLSRSGDMLVLKGHEQRLVPWSISFHTRLHNRPEGLRCDLTVPYFCFSPIECLLSGHSADGFGDLINCRFTCWIPGYLPYSP
jgi:hypothetical protein